MTTGTDSRRHRVFFVDNEVIDDYKLGPYAGWLYIVILRHVNFQTNVAFPSLATLAKECDMSEPTVIKYLNVLVEANLIRIHQAQDTETKEYGPNSYEAMAVQKAVNDVYQGGKTDLPGVVNDVKGKDTKENNTNEQDAAQKEAPLAPAGKPPRKRKPDPIFDVIGEYSFKIPAGSPVGKRIAASIGAIKREVLTTYPDMTAGLLRRIYEAHKPYASPQAAGVISMIGKYRARHMAEENAPQLTDAEMAAIREQQFSNPLAQDGPNG